MAAIWEQGHGHSGGNENAQHYERFLRFLEMGPSRKVTALALQLGIRHQSLSEVARRFNWNARAAAYDRAQGRGGKRRKPVSTPAPTPSEPPRPQRPPKVRLITPEVLDSPAGQLVETHLQAMARYRDVYAHLGESMAAEAEALFPVIQAMRGDIDRARDSWQQLVAMKEIQLADTLARQLLQLIPCYHRLSEAMHGHANGGRQHWGDAIGVHGILQEAHAAQQRREKG